MPKSELYRNSFAKLSPRRAKIVARSKTIFKEFIGDRNELRREQSRLHPSDTSGQRGVVDGDARRFQPSIALLLKRDDHQLVHDLPSHVATRAQLVIQPERRHVRA